jgi:putative sterol carrier protein
MELKAWQCGCPERLSTHCTSPREARIGGTVGWDALWWLLTSRARPVAICPLNKDARPALGSAGLFRVSLQINFGPERVESFVEKPAMTLQELTSKMKEGASKKSAFGNTVKFATDQGVVYIDGNQNPPAVTNDDKAADCTIKMDFGDFTDMIGGKLDGMTAFMTGKLKIEGDMGVAMKLQSILR